jgi:molybdopterin-biosynthesis enzyme MoeA-like protein
MTASPPPPSFGLLIIGDEILSGKRADQHLSHCIELLEARGLQLAYAEYLGDDRPRLTAALRRAFASGDIVFSCGGIGATPDDHTRACAALALECELELHPEAAALIRERMQDVAREQNLIYDPQRADNLQRLNMAMFPQGARLIPNPYNKIAGFSFGRVHFLPGFPVMAWPMMAWLLDTEYADLQQARDRQELSAIIPGAIESRLVPVMEHIEAEFPGIKVFSLPSVDHPEYGVHIELGVKGRGPAVAQAYACLRQLLQQQGLTIQTDLVR